MSRKSASSVHQPQDYHDAPELSQQKLQGRPLYLHKMGLRNSIEEHNQLVHDTGPRGATVVGGASIRRHRIVMLATRPFPPSQWRRRRRRVPGLYTAVDSLPAAILHKLRCYPRCTSLVLPAPRVQQNTREYTTSHDTGSIVWLYVYEYGKCVSYREYSHVAQSVFPG
jgi:hypothetical protein